MPHRAREISSTGLYHIVAKGAGDRVLFLEDRDRNVYLKQLREAQEKYEIKLHAWCLMDNHVHLLAEESAEGSISAFMKYVDERYAQWFVDVHKLKGRVFRRPFWSEPISTDQRFLATVRYIHANPFVAGMCAASVYKWSSVGEYLGWSKRQITTTERVFELLGGREEFVQYSRGGEKQAVPFSGSRLRFHITESEAFAMVCKILNTDDPATFGRAESDVRSRAIRQLLEAGLTVTQSARIIEVSRSLATREKKLMELAQ